MSLADRLANATPNDRVAQTRIAETRNRVQERLVETLGPRLYDAALSDSQLEGLVQQHLRELLDEEESALSAQEKLVIVRQIADSVLGLGPLEPFAARPRRHRDHGERLGLHLRRARRQDLLDRCQVPRRRPAPPDHRQDRGQGRSPGRRDLAVRGRAPARRLPRERGHPTARDRRRLPDHPEVLRRPVRGGRPDLVRDPHQADRRSPRRLCPGAHEHPGLRGDGRGEDDDAERAVVVAARRRAHPHDRGLGGAPAPAATRGAPRVPTAEHRGPRRGHDPRPGAERPAYAPGQDRGRRGPWRRGPGHDAGHEHRPRRFDHDHPRELAARRAVPCGDDDADGRDGPRDAGDPGTGRLGHST